MATTIDPEIMDAESVESHDSGMALMALNASEIDTQIATAKKYPRSIKMFVREATDMVTLTEEVAGECMYALKRAGKTIEGPSARFAEIIASAWGNCRAGARQISEDDRFVTTQGAFMDLQRNVAITYETKRRITDKHGRKFSDDMVGVASNAACSIALRNAVLKGVPKAFWKPIYDAARNTAIGNIKTLHDKRLSMIEYFQKMGVTEAQILELLEVAGIEDIGLDHIALLKGIATSLRDGETTIEQAFGITDKPQNGARAKKSDLKPQKEVEPVTEPESEGVPIDRLRSAFECATTEDDINAVWEECQSYGLTADQGKLLNGEREKAYERVCGGGKRKQTKLTD